jgi:hypothetical protein
MMATVAICGDSFFDFDDRFPDIHWRDKLSDQHKIYTLARGGASNFTIGVQIYQCLQFNPSMVFISFTTLPRIEFIKDQDSITRLNSQLLTESKDPEEFIWGLRDCNFKSYDHALPNHNHDKLLEWMPWYIEELEIVKNYFYIISALAMLKNKKIPFYFSLGGFEEHANKTYLQVPITFEEFQKENILPNSHLFSIIHREPWFHITDKNWHNDFANLAEQLIKENS